MPKILDIKPTVPGQFLVTVRPDGRDAATGRLLASSVEAGTDLELVGHWKSAWRRDGSGTITTPPGKWIFAEQGSERSVGFPILVVGGG